MFKQVSTIAAAGVLSSVVMLPVASAHTEGFYVRGQLGAAFNPKFKLDKDVSAAADIESIKYKTGFTGGVAAGYKEGPFRGEGELTYLTAKMKDTTSTGTIGAAMAAAGGLPAVVVGAPYSIAVTKAKSNVWAFMANGIYDFDGVVDPDVTPFVGVGIGYAHVKSTATVTPTIAGVVRPAINSGKGKGVFAYQLKAGVSMNFTPELAGSVDYRYFRTTKVKVDNFTNHAFQSHGINFGLTYRIG